MPQGARTFAFTMNKMMHIAFGPIPLPDKEPSLLYTEERDESPPLSFYIDDIFVGHEDFCTQFAFVMEH
jgi:hypothetical protein